MIRLLHISDVHLGAPLGGFGALAEQRRRAVRDALRRLPRRADELAIDAVLVTGDLFDAARPEAGDVDVAREVLRGLAAGGRPVFAVPGNHDPATGRDSPWRSMPGAITTILEPRFGAPESTTVGAEDERLHVYGVAHDPAAEDDPLPDFGRAKIDDDEAFHVVLLHAGTADHPDWTGGDGLRTTTAELAGLDADYVALGDHHQYRPPSAFGGAAACYPGSFAAVAVDEVGPHGCAIVELERGAPPHVRLEPSGVPPLRDLGEMDVGDAEDEQDVAERVGGRLDGADAHPVVTLTGEPAFPLDVDRVCDSLTERFGFAVVRDRTRFIDSERVRALAERPTVSGHVARLGLERIRAADDEAERSTAERALRLALGAIEADAP